MAPRLTTVAGVPSEKEVLDVMETIVSSMGSTDVTIDRVVQRLARHFNVQVEVIKGRYRTTVARMLPELVARQSPEDTISISGDAESVEKVDTDSSSSFELKEAASTRTTAAQDDSEEEIEEVGNSCCGRSDSDQGIHGIIEVAPVARIGSVQQQKPPRRSSATQKSKNAAQEKLVKKTPRINVPKTNTPASSVSPSLLHQRARSSRTPTSEDTVATPPPRSKRPLLKTSAGRLVEVTPSTVQAAEVEGGRRMQSAKEDSLQQANKRLKKAATSSPQGLKNLTAFAKAAGLFSPNSKLQREVNAISDPGEKCTLLLQTLEANRYTFERKYPLRKEIDAEKKAAEIRMARDGMEQSNILEPTTRRRKSATYQSTRNDGGSSGSDEQVRFGYADVDEEQKDDSSDASVMSDESLE